MKFSVVIPAHNEEGCIAATLNHLKGVLGKEGFDFEIFVAADHCTDSTEFILAELAEQDARIRWKPNPGKAGFGMAVRFGLQEFVGDAVAIYMADASDIPEDLCRYFKRIESGAECVFGSRFIAGGFVEGYPRHKLILNRIVNFCIRLLFGHGYNDTTNAFKCYRRKVIDGCRPFLAPHFNFTVELPLKAVTRGYRYEIIPIGWRGRDSGVSKMKLKEMGSRYFFIILYCLLEKVLVNKDYHREERM